MIRGIKAKGYLKTEKVERAMLSVDRKIFIPETFGNSAYEDTALPIGHMQTISAPGIVALMLETLDVKKGMKILEVGTGSGYSLAVLSFLAGPESRIISVESVPELAEKAEENMKKCGAPENFEIKTGDGSRGRPEEAPFDRIIVTAAMPYVKGHPLIKQLKKDGMLVAPAGTRYRQELLAYRRKTDDIESILPVIFVPLTGKFGFRTGM